VFVHKRRGRSDFASKLSRPPYPALDDPDTAVRAEERASTILAASAANGHASSAPLDGEYPLPLDETPEPPARPVRKGRSWTHSLSYPDRQRLALGFQWTSRIDFFSVAGERVCVCGGTLSEAQSRA
jgi:hypothetical protein